MVIDEVLSISEAGLRVMPLLPKNKVPILRDWQIKATTDESKIRQWFIIHKDANWGIATGMDSGVFVVDLDPKAGGDKAWKRLVKKHGGIPDTVTVKTGGGGTHLYFRYPKNANIKNSASKIAPGVDIRGDGGQVVAPGSVHPNGTLYEWTKGHELGAMAIAKPPKWLLELMEQTADEDSGAIGDPMEKGTRNNQIYHQSLLLARQGALQEVTLIAMNSWAHQNGEKDIPEDEIAATVASAYKKAKEDSKSFDLVGGFERSDTGNAQRLIKASGDVIRYIPSIGWHTWSGQHWCRDVEDLSVTRSAIEAIEQYKTEVAEQLKLTTDRTKAADLVKTYNWLVGSHSLPKLNAMISTSKAFPEVVRSAQAIDGDETIFLLNFLNGTLDLRTGELKPHDPNDLITRLVPHNYDPKAKCPTWQATLNLAFNKDKELISYFQRAIGYSLSGALSEQAFFICWGSEGNNGKSTMLEAIQEVLGADYVAMTDTRVISSKDKDNHILSSLAALHGVRIVNVNEIADVAVLDEELLKQLTGGDLIQAKRLYSEPFVYRPRFKIFMRANNKPIVRTTGEAFWRRVKLIPFEHPIPKDKRRPRHEIDAELAAEAEGILAWAVRGFQDWFCNGGLRDPAPVQLASAEYREASDVVAQFMAECTEKGDKAKVLRKDLYQAFRSWHEESGMRFPMSAVKFSTKVANMLGQHSKIYYGKQTIWQGIQLTDQAIASYAMMR